MLNLGVNGPIGMCDIYIGAYTLGVTRTRGNTSCSVCVYFIVKVCIKQESYEPYTTAQSVSLGCLSLVT